MEKQKRFQNQTLNSEDYEKTEKGARAVKNGGGALAVAALLVAGWKKYGPTILKSLSKLRKI